MFTKLNYNTLKLKSTDIFRFFSCFRQLNQVFCRQTDYTPLKFAQTRTLRDICPFDYADKLCFGKAAIDTQHTYNIKYKMVIPKKRKWMLFMKKILCSLIIISTVFTFAACGKTRILHCDSCGKEITVKESSDMEEDWIIYCKECNEKLFGDDPVLANG